ncbi:Nucleotidylyl transferase [Panus rudis PR-1116 ss-1]|nr:Nucleotidylyl transferase [Panus rudis PR-1116 ss-1]
MGADTNVGASGDSAILLARLNTIETPPYHLTSPIATATRQTRKQLRIILLSPLFKEPDGSETFLSRTAQWDNVQRLLTYVYVQTTKVMQELDNILMDVDVLLLGTDKSSTPPLGEVQRVYRVLPQTQDTDLDKLSSHYNLEPVWLEPSLHEDTEPVPPPPVPLHPTDSDLPPLFPVCALGGTFDHLHAGHKILLSMAAWITSEKLIVGVTDDALLKNKANKHVLESIDTRCERVRQFLVLFNPTLVYDIVPINDVYGPTAWDPNIQALVVSRETLSGGKMIDKVRAEKSLPPLKTFVIDVISSTEACLDHDDAEVLKKSKMSSTLIREWIVKRQEKLPQGPH